VRRSRSRPAAQGFFDDRAPPRGTRPRQWRCRPWWPVGFLVPGQQITGEAHPRVNIRSPTLTIQVSSRGYYVRSGHEHPDHMDEDYQHHQGGAPVVDTADLNQPYGTTFMMYLDAIVGVGRGGVLIDGQEDAR